MNLMKKLKLILREIKPNHYLANGMMRLDELANYFDIPEEKLEVEDVDTIAGLVVKELGRIANVDDLVQYGEFTFTVKKLTVQELQNFLLYVKFLNLQILKKLKSIIL